MGRLFKKIIFILLILSVASFAKEKDIPAIPPPVARPQIASVYRGNTVEVSLQANGRIVEPLNFLIRTPPKHGKLGEIRRTGRTAATVTYTPNPGSGPDNDSFTFAAQSFDSPVSAPARVRVQISEQIPRLEYIREIDFGDVCIGESVVKDIAIKNTGGEVATGKIESKLPWTVLDPSDYQIPPGRTWNLHLSFSPTEEREFNDQLHISRDPQSIIVLHGRGIIPVTWAQKGISLSSEQREKGQASIVFTNHTPKARSLIINWPSFVKAPQEIVLPAKSDVAVQVSIPPDDPTTFNEELPLHSGGFQGQIALKIFPPFPKLSISPEHEINLGETQAGRVLKGHFVVRNTGITDAPLRLTTSSGILVFPDPSNIILSSGQEQAFDIQLETTKAYTGNIQIESPPSPAINLAVKASQPTPASQKSSLPVENFLRISPTIPEKNISTYSTKIPPVQAIKLVSSETHEIEIRWALTSPEISSYKIERRKISINGEQTLVEWVPWPEIRIRIQNGEATAHFERMPSNSFWTIRILGVDSTGAFSTPSPAFRVQTLPVKDKVTRTWIFSLVAIGLIASLIELRRRRHRKWLTAHNERISRLGKN